MNLNTHMYVNACKCVFRNNRSVSKLFDQLGNRLALSSKFRFLRTFGYINLQIF
jgi:hypothetical protein